MSNQFYDSFDLQQVLLIAKFACKNPNDPSFQFSVFHESAAEPLQPAAAAVRMLGQIISPSIIIS